jgi:hypothetical protein
VRSEKALYIRRSWCIVVFCVLTAVTATANANDKGQQLRRTMADIALLNSQMAQRKADATEIREALSARLGEIEQETLEVRREKKIKSRTEALDEPRLYHNLLLMAEIETYADRYIEKINYYRVACDRLTYLYQQADDDLKIVSTLSDLKIDALVSQAQKIVDGYLPDAQTIVIQSASLKPASPERIWARLEPLK